MNTSAKLELTLELVNWGIFPDGIEIEVYISEFKLVQRFRYTIDFHRWHIWTNYWASCYEASVLNELVMKNETLAPFLDKMLPAVIAADS